MKHYLSFGYLFLFSLNLIGQANTDIHVFDLSVNQTQVKFKKHKQITKQVGYENQAHFIPNSDQFYFAATNASGLTDIYLYDLNSKNTKQITQTFLSSEYSPTPTPDGLYVSCIRQGADGSQNLVKYPVGGGKAIVLIDNHLIGYHIWLDDSKVLTFVLNKASNDMYLHDLSTGVERKLASNIGRCFKYIPNRSAISYIQLNDEGSAEIKALDTQSLEMSSITNSLGKVQDYAWLSKEQIILAQDSKIYSWSPDQSWSEISDLSSEGIKGITRISVNSKRDKIAFISKE